MFGVMHAELLSCQIVIDIRVRDGLYEQKK